jgi:hypothetical protein
MYLLNNAAKVILPKKMITWMIRCEEEEDTLGCRQV